MRWKLILVLVFVVSLVFILGCAQKQVSEKQIEQTQTQQEAVPSVEGEFVNEIADLMVESTSNTTSSG